MKVPGLPTLWRVRMVTFWDFCCQIPNFQLLTVTWEGEQVFTAFPESSTYGTAPVKKSWVEKRTTPRKLTWNLKNPALKFHVSFQRTMYTYMYYTILTIYYILSSWERCRFKGMCWKKSFKVHRGVLIAKCGQNADHLGILDSQTVQITSRWHGLLRKMGHASI